ncbi:hypothetical protein Ciccas_008613 [Cichlidogyrus casuarinus]|uniref:Uncharacterized protein n=1 Tax=Cichlidogyrus casuarinus TaxID=1844966 RepID=A0ABD2Q236_9PLAT
MNVLVLQLKEGSSVLRQMVELSHILTKLEILPEQSKVHYFEDVGLRTRGRVLAEKPPKGSLQVSILMVSRPSTLSTASAAPFSNRLIQNMDSTWELYSAFSRGMVLAGYNKAVPVACGGWKTAQGEVVKERTLLDHALAFELMVKVYTDYVTQNVQYRGRPVEPDKFIASWLLSRAEQEPLLQQSLRATRLCQSDCVKQFLNRQISHRIFLRH